MNDFDGRVAAITGAGSGIGRALALQLAHRGAHLALADLDAEGLYETARRCEGAGVKVTPRVLDVADRASVHEWAGDVVAEHGQVNLVVNNAGVALAATVDAMAYDDLDWLTGVNFWGVVHGTKAFLPHLKATGEGHVVNVSSVFGLIGIPGQSAYNAAKFGVRGFSEALRMELDLEDCGVSCTVVHPGGIKTDIARRMRIDASAERLGTGEQLRDDFDRLARTTPEKAARRILEAVRRNERRVLIGADAWLFAALSRLPARIAQGIVVRAMRRGIA